MGTPENIDAVAIVSTNILRSGINTKKAEIISKSDSPQLIKCAAYLQKLCQLNIAKKFY